MADGAWPPDYSATLTWRIDKLRKLRESPLHLKAAKAFYKTHPADFVHHWCDTYDPRNANISKPTRMPFLLFEKQRQLVEFFYALLLGQCSGLVEKSRDMGATWAACAFSVWMWLFIADSAIGWGSRKEQYVDKLGDPTSIFEKIRRLLSAVPDVFLPVGYDPKRHLSYMRVLNPESGATIIGEAGDNIGRGGRTSIYFKDESSHYERPELIEAALMDNTRVQVDMSSVNGTGNPFHRRRESGTIWTPGAVLVRTAANVFVMDWRDHPAKTQAWYTEREAQAIAGGVLHKFRQEVDRDYSASVEGIIIPPDWVKAAIDAHVKLKWPDEGMWGAALDVADGLTNTGGGDRNALALRKGPVLKFCDEWGARDTGVTTRKAITMCQLHMPLALQYDGIGVGSGVKAEANRLKEDNKWPEGLCLVVWNAGGAVQNPEDHVIPGDRESVKNKDFYTNLKAQGWWELRLRFERTWRAITEGIKYHHDELISLPSTLSKLHQITKELSQPTASQGARLKLVVDKTPEGTKSPNMGDAVVMAYWPMKEFVPSRAFVGTYGVGGEDE